MNDLLKKADRILIIGCLFAALLLGIFFALHRTGGSTVRVLRDGIELKQIALHDGDRDSQAIYFLIKYKVTDRQHKQKTSKIYTEDAVETEVIYYEKRPELPKTGSYNLISVADGRKMAWRWKPLTAGIRSAYVTDRFHLTGRTLSACRISLWLK